MSRTTFLLASAICLAGLARAEDRFVNPLRPGAYPTLQAALDAANPGDRILVEVDLPAVGFTLVTKSVTIDSADGLPKVLNYTGDALMPGTFLIAGLNPPLPLVLRSLAFRFYRGDGSVRDTVGIRTQGHYLGDMHMDCVSIDDFTHGQVVKLPSTLVDVDFDRLWLHYCRIVAQDVLPIVGLDPLAENTGSDCLVARVRQLVIEDSELWAGSAPFVRYAEGNQAPFGGRGGHALIAPTDATVVVGGLFSDGNGGSVETGPWAVAPIPGTKGATQWMGTGSMFQGWESVHGPAFDGGVVAVPDPVRDTQVVIDHPTAPLHMGGNAFIGGAMLVDINLTSSEPCAVLVGIRWGFVPVSPGNILWIDPTKIFWVFPFVAPSASVIIPIPNDPRLLGVPMIGQPVMLLTGNLMNPSAMMIR